MAPPLVSIAVPIFNTAAFLPVFKQALMRRGIPKRLYVDNGALYRSTQLSLVCAKLGITLIHARPYLPQGKGYASHCTSRVGFEADLRFRFAAWIPFHL